MPFEAQAVQLAKDPEHPSENQDAYAFDLERGIAAVADGVSSAIFSGVWAETLVQAVAWQPPDPDDAALFADWLAQCRRRWSEQIDTTGLAWFQKAKLPTGAFSTLLWAQLLPLEPTHAGSFGGFRLLARAIGDSCLFHVRHGELLRCFPMTSAAEFETNPLALGSVDLGRDALMKFATLDVVCYPDDHLLLTTDAVAEWLYRRVESQNPPDWSTLWRTGQSEWVDEINSLRVQREMRYDDATVLALRVTSQMQPEASELHGEAQAAEARAPTYDATAEEPLDATVEDATSPTQAALHQIADGFNQLADESLRAGRTLLGRLRDRFRR
jgi:serine/threonine protein phosphatase PrpC